MRGRSGPGRICPLEIQSNSRCERWPRPDHQGLGRRAPPRKDLRKRHRRRLKGPQAQRRPQRPHRQNSHRDLAVIPIRRAIIVSDGLPSTEPSGQTTRATRRQYPHIGLSPPSLLAPWRGQANGADSRFWQGSLPAVSRPPRQATQSTQRRQRRLESGRPVEE